MGVEIEGAAELQNQLARLSARWGADQRPVVAVGYTAAYASYVHENMEIWPPGMRLRGLPRGQGLHRDGSVVLVPKRVLVTGKVGGKHRGFYWDPQGRAKPKFLEDPAKRLHGSGEFARIMVEGLKKGMTLAQALMVCGLRLQRESQAEVPVETGNLRASAFTRMESLNGAGVGGAGPILAGEG